MRLAIDVETTGLDATKDAIVSLAWLNIENKAASWSGLIRTHAPIPAEVSAIHGIHAEDVQGSTAWDLADCLTYLDCYVSLFLEVGETVEFWAHNAKFDRGFIERAAQDLGLENLLAVTWRCSGLESRERMGLAESFREDGSPRFAKLKETVERIAPWHPLEPARYHVAEFDVECVARIVRELYP